ncbi:hypothetical protein ACWX0O_01695 [Nitrobacteraceae bacterium UC4449_H16]
MSNIFIDAHPAIHGTVRKLALAAAGTITVPQGAAVTRIFIRNKTANAVTGGVKIGTTEGGVDVLAAGAVGASAVVTYPALIGAVNVSAARTLYVDAVTALNSAVLDIAVEYTEVV